MENLEPSFNVTQAVVDFNYTLKEIPDMSHGEIMQLLVIAYDMFEEDDLLIDPESMGL